MSPRILSAFVASLWLFAVVPTSFAAAEFRWVPKGATGTHSIVGQEITLTGAGQEVTLHLEMSGWDPLFTGTPLLGSFQAAVDSSGYTSGTGTALNPLGWPNTPTDGAFQAMDLCTINFLSDPDGAPCEVPADCPGEFCIGNAFFVLQCCDPLPAISTASLDYEFAAAGQVGGRPDTGISWYAATLILEVPLGASGTYTVGFLNDPDVTLMRDVAAQPITPIDLVAVQITVTCGVDADCEDNNDCTDDSCEGGTCVNATNYNDSVWCCNPANGDLTLLNDGNPCTSTVCDLQTGLPVPTCLPQGTVCGLPAIDPCDAQNTCDGNCNCVNNKAPAGTACGSGTDNECTDPDTCDGLGACDANHAPGGTSCGDQSTTQCTNPDTCANGNCRPNNRPNGTACDDGAFCTTAERCIQGNCTGATDTCAPDNVGCTDDSCDEVNLACLHTPNDALCDNGLFCDGSETCDAALDCQAGVAPDCDDLVGCTDDSCNEGTDSCDHVANNANCDDNLFCNGAETCHATNDCQAGSAPNCSDGVACTDDSCNEGTDSCDNTPNNANCDNGVFCDGAETCHATLNCQAGTPPSCDDGVGCTDDSCNVGTDSCDNIVNNANCDDGLFCNGAETCDAALDCQAGVAPDCDDLVGCTDDSCNEGTDSCDHVANNANCDDSLFCNGSETCHATLDCQSGTAVNCDDGVGCTDDSCNEGTDSCDNIANNANCDDGLFCNGSETCSATLDCQGGTAVNCDDGVDCTDDSCNEGTDSCDNIANDANCPDDGLFCNGSEFCDAALGCEHTGSPCGGPCDEENDVCLCDAPIVVAAGSRYLAITLQPPGAGPQAIVVRGACAGGVARYVGEPVPFYNEGLPGEGPESFAGLLVDDPADAVFLTPAEWGDPVYVTGLTLAPGSTYEVWADCGSPGNPAFSGVTTASTYQFGDVDGNGITNFIDVQACILAFKGEFLSTPAITRSQTDLESCSPNLLPNINDALWAILGFQHETFADVGCTNECPPD